MAESPGRARLPRQTVLGAVILDEDAKVAEEHEEFICLICELHFPDQSLLEEHELKVHGSRSSFAVSVAKKTHMFDIPPAERMRCEASRMGGNTRTLMKDQGEGHSVCSPKVPKVRNCQNSASPVVNLDVINDCDNVDNMWPHGNLVVQEKPLPPMDSSSSCHSDAQEDDQVAACADTRVEAHPNNTGDSSPDSMGDDAGVTVKSEPLLDLRQPTTGTDMAGQKVLGVGMVLVGHPADLDANLMPPEARPFSELAHFNSGMTAQFGLVAAGNLSLIASESSVAHASPAIIARCFYPGCGEILGIRRPQYMKHRMAHKPIPICPVDNCGIYFANESFREKHMEEYHKVTNPHDKSHFSRICSACGIVVKEGKRLHKTLCLGYVRMACTHPGCQEVFLDSTEAWEHIKCTHDVVPAKRLKRSSEMPMDLSVQRLPSVADAKHLEDADSSSLSPNSPARSEGRLSPSSVLSPDLADPSHNLTVPPSSVYSSPNLENLSSNLTDPPSPDNPSHDTPDPSFNLTGPNDPADPSSNLTDPPSPSDPSPILTDHSATHDVPQPTSAASDSASLTPSPPPHEQGSDAGGSDTMDVPEDYEAKSPPEVSSSVDLVKMEANMETSQESPLDEGNGEDFPIRAQCIHIGCGAQFIFRSPEYRHHRWAHPPPFSCPLNGCDEVFPNGYDYLIAKHLVEGHAIKKPDDRALYGNACRACGRVVERYKTLMRHEKYCLGFLRLFCMYPGCNSKHSFGNASRMSEHIGVYHRQRNCRYFCSFDNCDKKFYTAKELQNHINVHTGARPYSCPHKGCKKAYKQVAHLQYHLLHHDDDKKAKPGQCPYCRRVFKARSSIIQHIRYMCKSNPTTFKHARGVCVWCGKWFENRKVCSEHQLSCAKQLSIDLDPAENEGTESERLIKRISTQTSKVVSVPVEGKSSEKEALPELSEESAEGEIQSVHEHLDDCINPVQSSEALVNTRSESNSDNKDDGDWQVTLADNEDSSEPSKYSGTV